MTTLIVGCGYLGERVAKILLSRGETLHALTRRPERATELASLGITPLVGNWLDLESMPQLPEVDRLVVAVSHRPVEGLELERTHTAGLDSLLAKRTGVWKRAIYISTTGVYAQDGGVWVNEESACDPKRGGGVAALHGEKWFSQHFPQEESAVNSPAESSETSWGILRMAGLYGPGRVPRLESMKRLDSTTGDEPIPMPSGSYLNLVHIDDAAAITCEGLDESTLQGTFLVSDGEPVDRREYYRCFAKLAGMAEPKFVEPTAELPGSRRSESNKRIDTTKLRTYFRWKMRYSDYRQGLAACLASDSVDRH